MKNVADLIGKNIDETLIKDFKKKYGFILKPGQIMKVREETRLVRVK